MDEMNSNNVNIENPVDQAAEPLSQAAEPTPQAAEPLTQTAPAPEKKPNNAIKFIIPIAVFLILAIILVSVAAATGMFGGNGKKAVIDALTATFTESGDALKEVWDVDAYEGMFEDEQMSIEADLAVAGDADLEMQYNKDNQLEGMHMDISYMGISLAEAIFYMDEEEVSLGLPNLTEYVFYVDRTTLEEDIWDLVDEGIIDEETAEAIVTLNQGSQDLNGTEEEIAQGSQDILNAMKDIFNNVKVKKADSKTLEVNGENQNCKGYALTLSPQQIADFFLAYKDVYEENEAFRNYFNQLVALELGYDGAENLLEDIDPAEEFLNFADEAVESGDEMIVYFYLYDGTVAQIYTEEDEDNYLEWNIKGGNFPLENMELTLVIDRMENTISRSGSMEDENYCAEYAFDVAGEEFYVDLNYDKSSGDFDVNVYDYYSDCVISGNIENTIPGSELVVEIYSFEIDGEEIFYGDFTISNECGSIEKPEGEQLDVLHLTEDEWYDIIEEIVFSMIYSMY